jgi:peptide/nickel transport system permease protein
MGRYLVSRVLLIIPTMILVIFIVFAILNITPGNPAQIILGNNADPAAIDALNRELGMDRPPLERFGSYLWGMVQGDFGESYRSGQPVFDEILMKFPTTLILALFAVLVSTVLGVALGIISAVRQYKAVDYTLTVASLIIASMPAFLLALILILVFSFLLRLLPSSGIGTPAHYVLPVVTLALPQAAMLARMTRASMLETMRQDYIRTARAKGADKVRVVVRHALKPAILPIVTLLGMGFALLLGGTLIIEIVFGLPGIGNVIMTAVKMKDTPVILAAAILLTLLYKLIMLLVDIIQAYIDPRLKLEGGAR